MIACICVWSYLNCSGGLQEKQNKQCSDSDNKQISKSGRDSESISRRERLKGIRSRFTHCYSLSHKIINKYSFSVIIAIYHAFVYTDIFTVRDKQNQHNSDCESHGDFTPVSSTKQVQSSSWQSQRLSNFFNLNLIMSTCMVLFHLEFCCIVWSV